MTKFHWCNQGDVLPPAGRGEERGAASRDDDSVCNHHALKAFLTTKNQLALAKQDAFECADQPPGSPKIPDKPQRCGRSHARGIRQDPKPEYLSSFGTALQRQGRHEEALKAFDKAVQLKPGAGLWTNLGHILVDLRRLDEAVLCYQRMLQLNPRDWDAISKSGFALPQAGRFQDAYACFDRCNELQPNHVPSLFMRGRALIDLGRLEEALVDYRRAHVLDPDSAEVCTTIGVILRSQGPCIRA
jgi:tetratricopeptide (TPR) repeat protein